MFGFLKGKNTSSTSITRSDYDKVEKFVIGLRNSYHKTGFNEFKKRHSEWFKNNPNVFTIPTKSDMEYASSLIEYVSIINRDYEKIKCKPGESPRSSYGESETYDKYEEVYYALMDDIKSLIDNSEYADKLKVDDGGDWDTGSIDVVFKNSNMRIVDDISNESVGVIKSDLDSIMMEATSEDRAKCDRENSIKDASNGIVELIRSHGMESWFSSDEDKETSRVVDTNGYPKIESICKGIQSELKKVYKSLPGYKESQKLCKDEYDDILYMEFDKIELYDNSVYIVGFNQDGITKEYESSLKSFVSNHIDKIKSVYPDLDIIVDVNDDGTNLTIYFE